MVTSPARHRCAFASFLLVILVHPPAASAAGACAQPGTARTLGDRIRLESDGPGNAHRILERAVAKWAACGEYGRDFPRFVVSGPAFRTLHVRFLRTSPSQVCGQFSRDTILLYASAHDRQGRRVACDLYENNLAHELGHALGLLDAPPDAPCRRAIMAQDDLRQPGRRVAAEECAAAASRWLTSGDAAIARPRP